MAEIVSPASNWFFTGRYSRLFLNFVDVCQRFAVTVFSFQVLLLLLYYYFALQHPFIKALTAPDHQDDLQVKKSTAGTLLFK